MARGLLFLASLLLAPVIASAKRVASGEELEAVYAARLEAEQVATLEAEVRDLQRQLQEARASERALDAPAGDSLEWINEIVRKLWPRVDNAVNHILDNVVTPLVNDRMKSISSVAPTLEFETFTLGSQTPILGPIRLYDLEGGGLKIHMNLDYQSDVDVKIRFGVLRLGVERLHVSGELVIKLSPLIDEVPILGGIGVYFYDAPKIGLDFTGLGNAADIPGVSNLIWSTVTGIVNDMLVIPNIFGIAIASPAQINQALVFTSQPLGMLRVRTVRASNLAAGDYSVWGARTSDPLVQLSLGSSTWASSVVSASLDPQFLDDDVTEFMVYSREQMLRAVVMDQDTATYNDVLGYASRMTVRDALAWPAGVPIELLATDPQDMEAPPAVASTNGQGQLLLLFEWLALDEPLVVGDTPATDKVVVDVEILQVEIPWAIGEPIERVALRATIGEGTPDALVQTTIAGGAPLVPFADAIIAAHREEEMDMVSGIVRRLAEEDISPLVISNATRLTEAQVVSVAAGGRAEPDPETKIYAVNRAMYFVMEREAVEADPSLKLELVNRQGEVIVDYTSPLSGGVLLTYHHSDPLLLYTQGDAIRAEIKVSIRGLRPGL